MKKRAESNSQSSNGTSDDSGHDLPEPRQYDLMNRDLAQPHNGDRLSMNGAAPAKSEFDIWRHIRMSLRGRYAWVIALGIVFGLLGGYGGWKLGHPAYVSTGLVRIAYELPQVLNETDQNGPMEMFDTFMQEQRLLITSRHVLDNAIQDPIWHNMGYPVPADPEDYFLRHLTVTINSRSEYIQISVSDRDPGLAAAAVNSVINAYSQLYERQERAIEDARMGALNDKMRALESTIQNLTDQINKAAGEFGTVDLTMFFDASADQVGKTASALDDIRNAIAMSPARASAGSDTQPSTQPVQLSVQEIAAQDQVMHGYLEDENRWKDQISHDLKSYGPSHLSVLRAQQSLNEAIDRVNSYAESYRQFHIATDQNLGDPGLTHVATAGRTLASLLDSEARLSKILDQERAEMVRLGNQRMNLDQLRSQCAADQEELAQVKRRSETLQSEDTLGGRMSITSTGEVPLGPATDPRLKLAAAGLMAGATFPALFLVLASLLVKGRFRYSEQADGGVADGVPLLGIIPAISVDSDDADEANNAAHSVHQIRINLQAHKPRERHCSVYLITSAASGEGKTSLTMSLGLSFAMTHQRTLLIDCDLVGRQLTRTLNARSFPGFLEAMVAGSFRRKLRKPAANLYLLPAGNVGVNDAFSLSSVKLRPLLEEARRHFDVILIDTGPILGSTEASVLAQEVDGVLFTITRDQRRGLVERAMRRLASLDARVEGLIFNRARGTDYESSVYSNSSQRSVGAVHHAAATSPPRSENLGGFGPLVQAVASTAADDATAAAPNGAGVS
jgi:Mrp family chromosome partitioning ATPase/uncharacterized protein involved in exopolysaccharide biosynthesis